MKRQLDAARPDSAIFADSSKRVRPLALHPDAMGVKHQTRKLECIDAEIVNGVAVLCVDGPLEHKGGGWWSFWQSYENLVIDFRSLIEDGSVQSIVLKFDSPGGECAGLNETVALMQRLKAKHGKPVYGYVDEACYSAAYALAMTCDEIYMPLSAGVGSIGVITAMSDQTKMIEKMGVRVEVIASGSKKTDGHPYVPLSDGAIKRTKKTVDKLAASFFDIVSEGRGLSVETVAGFQAGTFSGQDAVDVGLVDGIMSLEECLTFASNSRNAPSVASMQQEKEPTKMAGQLAAAKALKDAKKGLEAAKTESERALAAARVLAAEDLVAKVKKTKTVTTDTHEEEVDDGEPEESELPSDEEGDDDDDEDEGDDEEAAAASVGGSQKRSSVAALLSLARKLTGKHAIDEVMGALRGTFQHTKKSRTLASEVAALKKESDSSKLNALIDAGKKAGKLSPGLVKWARTQSHGALSAFLEAAPNAVHREEDEHIEAAVASNAAGAVTAEMARIWKKQGFQEKDFPQLLGKMNQKKTGA